MNKITRTGIEMIKASLILGFVGNLLIRTEAAGLNIAIWTMIFAAAMVAVVKRNGSGILNSNSMSLLAAFVFFGGMFAVFDSPELLFLDAVSMVLILGVFVMPAFSYDLTKSGVFHYFLGGFAAGASAAFGPIALVGNDIKWGTLPKFRATRHVFSALRGLVLAVPIGLVIGGLLMSADATFQSFILNTFNFDPSMIISHAVITSALAWLVLGYFRAAVFGIGPQTETVPSKTAKVDLPRFSITEHTTEDPDKKGPKVAESPDRETWPKKDVASLIPDYLRLGVIETSIVLGLMNALFFGFVVFQVPYLFGGMDLVQQTPDFKLAEYARRGVEELIAVSALVLPILLSFHWLLKKSQPINIKVFRILASVQIGLLFVIMISAAQRISLLTGNLGYGQTTIRFYSYFFLIWLALVFVWFGMTVLRGMRKQFAYGALWSFLFIVAMVHYVNPDDYIVRSNIALMKEGRNFDAQYNARLSSDALPALIEALDEMPEKHRLDTRYYLVWYFGCAEKNEGDIRSWNWSRSNAASLTERYDLSGQRVCNK